MRVWHGEGQALALREGEAFFTVARIYGISVRNAVHPLGDSMTKKGSVTRLTLPFYGEDVPIHRPFPLF